MTVTYDIRNQDTKQDFETLMRGLFEVGREKGYLSNLRNVLDRNEDIAEKVKRFVIVTGQFTSSISTTHMGENLQRIAKDLNDIPADNPYIPALTIMVERTVVVEVPEDVTMSHDGDHCADSYTLQTLARRRILSSIDDTPYIHSVFLDEKTMRTVCINDGCPAH